MGEPFREGPWNLRVETHPEKGVQIISDNPEDLSVGEIAGLCSAAFWMASRVGLDVQALFGSSEESE